MGTHWGDEGYMYLKKDMAEVDGICGINEDTTFPSWDWLLLEFNKLLFLYIIILINW